MALDRLVTHGALLGGALLISACANHLPQRSEHEARSERRLVDHAIHVEVGEPAVLDQPQRRVRIRDQKTFEVTDIEVTRRYDRYTPYQPWRELYEIPLGAVAVVGGVAANVVNVVAFGRLPESMTRDWISYGFAGLNPFLNVESNGRSQQSLASLEEKPSAARLEYLSLPWAEGPVMLVAGRERYELMTDRNGVLLLNLLDDPLAQQDLSAVDALLIDVEDRDGTRARGTLPLAAGLRTKLGEAHDLIFDDLEGDDVARWVFRVQRLAALGFEEEASELEQSLIELTESDAQLQAEFLDTLARKTGRHPAGASEDD